MRHDSRGGTFGVVLGAAMLTMASAAGAQSFPVQPQVFAPTNIGLAAAQAILRTVSQLPPVTNVGLRFRYDPALDTYVAVGDDLGSGMVPAARFAPPGTLTGIVSFAYFGLTDFAGNDSASLVVNEPSDRFRPNSPRVNVGLATRVVTDVYVTRLAGRYTIIDQLDVGLTLPLIVSSVKSSYLVQRLNGQDEIDQFARRGIGTPDVGGNTLIPPTSLNRGIVDNFMEGTNFDTGNMVLDVKYGLPLDLENVSLGTQVELRLPTGSESHFTGIDSTSLRGLLLASYQASLLGVYFAGGYEQDFSTQVLSNGYVAASLTANVWTRTLAEVGMNANFYQKAIDVFDSKRIPVVEPSAQVLVNNSNLGTDQVNFGGGVRVNPWQRLVVSAYATVPVTDAGYRPANVLALSMDYPF
jgi:hypothetical protein